MYVWVCVKRERARPKLAKSWRAAAAPAAAGAVLIDRRPGHVTTSTSPSARAAVAAAAAEKETREKLTTERTTTIAIRSNRQQLRSRDTPNPLPLKKSKKNPKKRAKRPFSRGISSRFTVSFVFCCCCSRWRLNFNTSDVHCTVDRVFLAIFFLNESRLEFFSVLRLAR